MNDEEGAVHALEPAPAQRVHVVAGRSLGKQNVRQQPRGGGSRGPGSVSTVVVEKGTLAEHEIRASGAVAARGNAARVGRRSGTGSERAGAVAARGLACRGMPIVHGSNVAGLASGGIWVENLGRSVFGPTCRGEEVRTAVATMTMATPSRLDLEDAGGPSAGEVPRQLGGRRRTVARGRHARATASGGGESARRAN